VVLVTPALGRPEANTRRMLEGMFRPLGYDDVTVVFQAPPKP
jgi:hypothetical protein